MKKKYAILCVGLLIVVLAVFLIQSFMKKNAVTYFTNDESSDVEPFMTIKTVSIDGADASYVVLTPKKSADKNDTGSLYSDTGNEKLYYLKDIDNLYQLILEENGTYSVLQFLEFTTPVSYEVILSKIYGAQSGDALDSITFYSDKSFNYNNKVMQNPTVTLNNAYDKETFYCILARIQVTAIEEDLDSGSESSITTIPYEPQTSAEELEEQLTDYEHNRKIDVTFADGITITYLYSSINMHIYTYAQTMDWSLLSSEDNDWLKEQAEIS